MRRATTIQKHSRFLTNLTVEPIFPPEPEVVEEHNDEEAEAEQEENWLTHSNEINDDDYLQIKLKLKK